jgi:tetratricopeptide (TPR) repeat protein
MFGEMEHFYPKTLLLIARQLCQGYMDDRSKFTASQTAYVVLLAGDALSLSLRDKTERPVDMHQIKDIWKDEEGFVGYDDSGEDPDYKEFGLTYFELGRAYLSRALRDGKVRFLPDAIRSYEASLKHFNKALHLTGEDNPNRATILVNLAGAYQHQHDEQEKRQKDNAALLDPSGLERGISYAREVLVLRPLGRPRRWEPLLSLGKLLERLYRARPSQDVFHEIVTNQRQGLEQLPQDYQYRLELMNDFVAFIQSLQPPLLTLDLAQEAVDLMRVILNLMPPGIIRLEHMMNVGTALDTLYQISFDVVAIEEAVAIYEEALQTLPKDLPIYRDLLNNLASSNNRRWAQTKDLAFIEASIRWRQQVLTCAPSHSNRGLTYHSLGVAHGIRHHAGGSIEDLEEGLRCFREAFYILHEPEGRTDPLSIIRPLDEALCSNTQLVIPYVMHRVSLGSACTSSPTSS